MTFSLRAIGVGFRTIAAISLLVLLFASPLRAQPRGDSAMPPAPAGPASTDAPSVGSQTPDVQSRSTPAQVAPPPDMPVATTDGANRSSTTGVRELSPWSMFLSADILVQTVMISLAFASLVTWTIFLAMTVQLFLARKRLNKALAGLAEARTLSEAQSALGARNTILSSLLTAAIHEVRISTEISADSRIQQRAASRFSEIVRTEARVTRQGMGILATIGSTSPFVGLFGTVWGIMNSFIGISKSQTTNLAVVAPGIAEALLATAFGLVAAIPAVIIYNHFSRATKRYLELVSRASGAVARLLSRDLDRADGGRHSEAAE
jgi:biopolymer transport protein ExbB